MTVIKIRQVLLIICILFLAAFRFSNVNTDICTSFINALNNNKNTDAEALCDDSLKVRFNYSGAVKSKVDFFTYQKKKAVLNPQIIIDSSKTINEQIVFFTKNTNAFNQYLKLHQLPLRYSFLIRNAKILELNVDSLKGYSDSLRINDKRWSYFENWVKSKHPEKNLYYMKIQHNDSLLILAKEFYAIAVKK